jgi:cytochrome c5
MKTRILVLALVGIFIYSCSPKTAPAPTEAKIELSPELAEGKNLYENNCAKCHNLKNPKDYNAQEWQPIMIRMQKKAKISDTDREKIYNYVTMN